MSFRLLEFITLGSLKAKDRRKWASLMKKRDALHQKLIAHDRLMSQFAGSCVKNYPPIAMTGGEYHPPGLNTEGDVVVSICPCPDCQAHFQGRSLKETTEAMLASHLIPQPYIHKAIQRMKQAVKKGVANLRGGFIN